MSTDKIQSQRALNSLRILMAEDDKLNQILSRVILKKLGCEYDIVENGLMALDAINKSHYDLILMDIEMPEMDGYEATLKIRNELMMPTANIPIIAITADASWQGLKKCQEVGINDYVFKPIVFEELVDKLNSVMAGKAGVFPTSENVKAAIVPAEKVFNIKSLYTACGENSVTVKNIIDLFIKQSPENIVQLKQYAAASDWQNLKNLCHKMKAVYSLLGLSQVKTYLEEMEDDCVKNNINLSKFESTISKIEYLNTGLVEELEKVLVKGIKP